MEIKTRSLVELLEHLRIGVFQSERREPGKILYANDAFARMHGFNSANELIGLSAHDFYQRKEDRLEFLEALEANGIIENWPLNLLRQDGTPLFVRCCAHVIYDDQGEFMCLEGIMLDETETRRDFIRREAMARLSQQFSRKLTLREVGQLLASESRRMFEHDAFTLAIYDEETRSTLTYVYSEDTPVGGSHPQEFDEGTLKWPLLNPQPQLINREPEDLNEPTRFVPFGAQERRSLSLMFSPMKYENLNVGVLSVQSYTPLKYTRKDLDQLVWLANTCSGAVERVKAEVALSESETMSRLLLNVSPFQALIVDRSGVIRDANAKACEQLGLSRREIIGAQLFDCVPGELAQDCRELLEQAWLTKQSISTERTHGTRTYHIECHAMKRQIGDEPLMAMFVQDITEIRRNERMAALGMTASGLAHYIKNVQMSLNSSIKLLDECLPTSDNERVQRMWPVAKRAAARVDQLVMDILNMAHTQDPELEAVNLNVFLEGLVEEYRLSAEVHGIELTFDGAPEELMAPMDYDQMWDVMLNLTNNAIDAIRETRRQDGRIAVRVSRDAERSGALIEVSDNGAGLKPEVKDRIFEVFFTTKGGAGTGLGLTVVKKIIEAHHGDIRMESAEGGGTTFQILLPLQ